MQYNFNYVQMKVPQIGKKYFKRLTVVREMGNR